MMSILIRRKVTKALAKDLANRVISGEDKPEILPPPRTTKTNWDPYFQKYKISGKEKKEMAVIKKVAVIKKEVVAKKEAVKVAKGKTIDDLWVEVLSAAVGKKLTDEQLAVQMSAEATKLTGKKREYDEVSVAGHRSGYNCGRFAIQKGVKPTVRLEKFEAVITPAKRK